MAADPALAAHVAVVALQHYHPGPSSPSGNGWARGLSVARQWSLAAANGQRKNEKFTTVVSKMAMASSPFRDITAAQNQNHLDVKLSACIAVQLTVCIICELHSKHRRIGCKIIGQMPKLF